MEAIMRRGRGLTIVVPGLALGALLLGTTAARADVTDPPGRCVGTASFAEGVDGPFTVDSRTLEPGDVITVPLSDDVTWEGSLVGVTEGQQRDISGFVKVDMPAPLPDITIDTWDGPATRIANNGVEEYSLPAITPRGVEIKVFGEHWENGTLFCSGSATIKVEGSPFSTPVTPVALVALLGSLALSFLASRKASLGLGVVAGLALGISLALALLFLGVVPLNSPVLTVLPVIGAVGGGVWGKLGVFAAATSAAG
jgi:hypothetical protein